MKYFCLVALLLIGFVAAQQQTTLQPAGGDASKGVTVLKGNSGNATACDKPEGCGAAAPAPAPAANAGGKAMKPAIVEHSGASACECEKKQDPCSCEKKPEYVHPEIKSECEKESCGATTTTTVASEEPKCGAEEKCEKEYVTPKDKDAEKISPELKEKTSACEEEPCKKEETHVAPEIKEEPCKCVKSPCDCLNSNKL